MVPVLYASTWLLTAFACPFPPAFSGRVIDVMLTEGRTHVLLRAALAVMLSCAEDLLALDDFEALITHLKVRCTEMYDFSCLAHDSWMVLKGRLPCGQV